ncbi:hypothetical protein NDA10_001604 [Ustilago hordei]|uniref:Large ribosomal subunit protein mL44 n=1 Tax=Ustilago hordei TaxID=120017 RepID=I2G0E6_USTHO|nr:uncharacterized protein UHO2_03562 [Ustilago hordei]KAJ1044236.1 hypothetical protein NDA10_001604 [Ustilago hordei]CCF52639.1 related to MRPL3-Mitochondrial ribosomal protein, large subunit [Ustilago hordei]SYW75168.1 related to MRPL3 - Mitochondrial ribosomal protein, large subunit [Ustilago hordei]
MSANRPLSRALRPLTQCNISRTNVARRQLGPSHTRSASTAVAESSSSSSSSTDSSTSYVHDPTPNVHLPRLARTEPELYAAVRPPPIAAFAALTARLGLIPISVDAATRERRIRLVHQACTHPSFQALVDKVNASANLQLESSATVSGLAKKEGASPLDSAQFLSLSPKGGVEHHAALATVGNSLLGMLATEFLHLRYPNLPTRVLKAAVSAYVGPQTLADVGAELGLAGQGILRWNKEARIPTQSNLNQKRGGRGATPRSLFPSFFSSGSGSGSGSGLNSMRTLLSRDVAADSMRALTAVIFQEQGLSSARSFVTSHFLNRSLNLSSLLKFNDPKHALVSTCAKYGKQAPQSRMIAESGRLSISPIFVVGVWSGATKIGEGSGSSIRMAEFRAAEDALRRLYLAETPLGDFDLPSATLDSEFTGMAGEKVVERGRVFSAQPIGETEVLAVAGKSRQ